MNPFSGLKILLLVVGLLVSSTGLADPFVGKFEGQIDGETFELLLYSDSSGAYDGELRNSAKRLPVFGTRYGDYMIGKIGFPEDEFAFRARIMGAVMLIERQSATPLRFFYKGAHN